MKPPQKPSATCPECGAQLPPDAAEGLCPRCIFRILDPESCPTTPGADLPGDAPTELRLGDYDLVELVARGGMGLVYKARQRSLRRWVAVKVISGGAFAAPDFVKRFRTEAEAAAALEHPNIVPIHEVGEDNGQPFFSMKLLEGGTLVDQARGGTPNPSEAARLLIKIARAVHYAHQRGILHRDIKPNNILLDSAGEPFLTDFGIAKLVAQNSTITHTHAILGTPAYMSPEQARGEARSLTTAADVYGLGAVLYELLTGQPPFAGGIALETVRMVLDKEPRRPSSINPAIDRDLETVCLKCLEKEPARRYGSAEALAEELERWLRHEPIRARPSTTTERLAKWVRRRPAIAALAAVALVAVLAMLLLSTLFSLRLGDARRAVALEAEANRRGAVRLLVAEATRSVEDGDYFGALLPLVEGVRRDASHPEHESLQRQRLGSLLRHCPQLRNLWLHSGSVLHASLSPDHRRIATASSDGTANIWSTDSGERIGTPLVHTSRVMQVVFSRDGRFLASQEYSGFTRLWDLASGPPAAFSLEHRAAPFEPIVFAPDGNHVVVPGFHSIMVGQLGAPTAPPIALEGSGAVHGLAFSPDGNRLVSGGRDGRALSWAFPTTNIIEPPLTHASVIRAAFFLPGTPHLVTIAEDRRIRLWDPATSALLQVTEPHRGDVMAWAVSPTPGIIATAGFDFVTRVWDLAHSKFPMATFPQPGAVDALNFTDDGRVLVTGSYDGTARRWALETGQPLFPNLTHASSVSVTLPEAAEGRLITGSFQGDVRQWRFMPHPGAQFTLQLPRRPVFAGFAGTNNHVVVVTEDGILRDWVPNEASATPWEVKATASATLANVSAQGQLAAVADPQGQVAVWKIGETRPRLTLAAHTARLRRLAFTPDAQRLVTASDDQTAVVWDLATGTPVGPRLKHGYEILWAEVSPDGQWIATSGMGGECHLWELGTGRKVASSPPQIFATAQVRFSPKGDTLVVASWDDSNDARAAVLWQPFAQGATPIRLWHRDGLRRARFSPDGNYVATGGEDNLGRVWSAQSGRPVSPLLRHRGYVTDLAFSPDSRLLATASRDGTARVWNTEDGQPVTPPLQHANEVLSVEFSPDGLSLLTASPDQTVRTWDLRPVDWPVNDLAALAELLGSFRLEPNGDRTPLSVAEMRTRWDLLRASHPEYFLPR